MEEHPAPASVATPPGEAEAAVPAVPLPARVHGLVVTLAADALGRMPSVQIPPALRRSASFAPARRAKLAGRQIAETLLRDEDFREHLATQVRALVPDTVAVLEAGGPVAPGELPQAAAVAYLIRTVGWQELVASAVDAEKRDAGRTGDPSAAVAKIAAQLEQARAETRQQRDKLRGQLDTLKADNAALRRTLGQTRTELKEIRAELAASAELLDGARREAEMTVREAAAEVRRMRARVAELEVESTATRRVARDDRDAEVIRLRLLLDTMVDAANGLRRELALPASSGLPADGVPTVEPGVGSAVSQVGRALLSSDPLLLRRLLELPRVHLIVDGYNVSKEAWPSASLEQQRVRLVAGLAGLVSGKGIETTVVFDGADLLHTPVVPSPRGVRVRFSPPGVIADDVIRQLVNVEPSGRPVVVVSTDREVAESVAKLGARSVSSGALVAILGR